MQDQFTVWKRNCPFLYDLLISHTLAWPSLCVSWQPSTTANTQTLVLGTYTGGEERNLLLIADVDIPSNAAAEAGPKVHLRQRIPHDGEVHCALGNPQSPHLIATKSPSPKVFVYDVNKHPMECPANVRVDPADFELLGHSTGGYGLAWHPTRDTMLLSGGEDGLIIVWDVARSHQPFIAAKCHKSAVEYVAWHKTQQWLFASVGDDKQLLLWDTRTSKAPYSSIEAHQNDVNCVAFHPSSDFLLATAGADRVVALWDHRNLSKRLHTFVSHTDDVLKVEFSPSHPTVLASGGVDMTVKVWDMAKIGASPPQAESAPDCPPELIFTHSGHTSRVADFAWNPSPGQPWMLASTSDDNILQIWRPTQYIYTVLDCEQPGAVPENVKAEPLPEADALAQGTLAPPAASPMAPNAAPHPVPQATPPPRSDEVMT